MRDRNKTLTDRGIENQSEGTVDRIKGKVKDAFGSLTGNRRMEGEGKIDQVKGKVKQEWGETQRDLDKPVL